ncbi:hypothetical protein ACQJBY_032575 [Aegilops geniculata]
MFRYFVATDCLSVYTEMIMIQSPGSLTCYHLFIYFQGLVPRAKLLLSLGGTFFLAFGPLIIVTVSLFAGLYLYFGQSFVHHGSKKPVAPPPYIDPYELLEDDRISRPSLDVF